MENLIFIKRPPPSPPRDVTLFPSQVSSFSPPSFSAVSLCSSPLFFLLSYACLHLSSFSSSPSCPHLPPISYDPLIPLSYSVFCPKHIFPPTRPRLIPLSLSIYLYQWTKVILSSSSRWADSACGRGQEKRGAEESGFSYFIISTVASGGNTTLRKLSFVRGDHLTLWPAAERDSFNPRSTLKYWRIQNVCETKYRNLKSKLYKHHIYLRLTALESTNKIYFMCTRNGTLQEQLRKVVFYFLWTGLVNYSVIKLQLCRNQIRINR